MYSFSWKILCIVPIYHCICMTLSPINIKFSKYTIHWTWSYLLTKYDVLLLVSLPPFHLTFSGGNLTPYHYTLTRGSPPHCHLPLAVGDRPVCQLVTFYCKEPINHPSTRFCPEEFYPLLLFFFLLRKYIYNTSYLSPHPPQVLAFLWRKSSILLITFCCRKSTSLVCWEMVASWRMSFSDISRPSVSILSCCRQEFNFSFGKGRKESERGGGGKKGESEREGRREQEREK